ncbi:MAG: NAD(P)-binding protein [Panacagrimonas sp.]
MSFEVAIVGSGPSGFYAAEALLETRPDTQVTMYERLPVPFGLVRFGVAPDHPRLKSPTMIFDKVAQHPKFRFVGNTTIGRDLSVEELREHHHATIFAYGAESDRSLGIPGENLPGSHTATEFVGWYNGHPDYRSRTFDLSHESVAIIGQGNVAADVARILSMPVDTLAKTDIASHAVDALRSSRVRRIHIIGRRGPAQAKFTAQELRELGEIPGTQVRMRASDLELNAESLAELQEKKNFLTAKNVELFRKWAAAPEGVGQRRLLFHFLESPVEIIGRDRVEGLVLERNRLEGSAFEQQAQPTGERYTLPCGMVFRSIGYQGVALTGLPFDARRCVLPNTAGRVPDQPGFYATGWIKRGPSGIIGTNRACAVETVSTLMKDCADMPLPLKSGAESSLNLLAGRGVRAVSYADWKRIDEAELQLGQERGKPREKFTSVSAMLACLSP